MAGTHPTVTDIITEVTSRPDWTPESLAKALSEQFVIIHRSVIKAAGETE